eukprot:TRINITY_DN2374_c0_g1_i1.p1 TRINITY_DN2374_c0_g1~~TRINITY_DN2374_c0_g1_i1.p1  ORF type:complete len:789 (+),score=115.35 TRINITY_DN2374_c0_g1_i1:75-2441(+)
MVGRFKPAKKAAKTAAPPRAYAMEGASGASVVEIVLEQEGQQPIPVPIDTELPAAAVAALYAASGAVRPQKDYVFEYDTGAGRQELTEEGTTASELGGVGVVHMLVKGSVLAREELATAGVDLGLDKGKDVQEERVRDAVRAAVAADDARRLELLAAANVPVAGFMIRALFFEVHDAMYNKDLYDAGVQLQDPACRAGIAVKRVLDCCERLGVRQAVVDEVMCWVASVGWATLSAWGTPGGYPTDGEAVQFLLDLGASSACVCPEENGATPLILAARENNRAGAVNLVIAGADVNAADNTGMTALMWAALSDRRISLTAARDDEVTQLALVQCLVENGAALDVQAVDDGATALMRAVWGGHEAVAAYLVEKGALVDVQNNGTGWGSDGLTALSLAGFLGYNFNGALVRLLMRKGARLPVEPAVLAKGVSGAAAAADEEMAMCFAKKIETFNGTDGHGACAVVDAWNFGLRAVSKTLVEKGADVNHRSMSGETLLMSVCKAGAEDAVEWVQLLAEHGADLDLTSTNGGMTALMFAATHGHTGVVTCLTRCGAALDTRGGHGRTALLCAAQSLRPTSSDAARFLIDSGCALAAQEADTAGGRIALHWAARNGNLALAAHMIAKGSPLDTRTTNGLTALQYAVRGNHLDLAMLLVSKGADVNNVDVDGWTALTFAVDEGNLELVRCLVGAGAALAYGTGEDATTALAAARSNARSNGRVDIVAYLLNAGDEAVGVTKNEMKRKMHKPPPKSKAARQKRKRRDGSDSGSGAAPRKRVKSDKEGIKLYSTSGD